MNNQYYTQPVYNAAPLYDACPEQYQAATPQEAANYETYKQYPSPQANCGRYSTVPLQINQNLQASGAPEFEKGVKIHGKNSALTIVASLTKKGFHTLNIEGANGLGDGTKKFDWQDKTIIQITATEYRHLLAVLFGFIPFIEFKSHGPQKNKSLLVKRQPNGFFVSINEGGKRPKAVPVSFDDAYLLAMYALDVFARNYPNIESHCLINTIQTFTQLPFYPLPA